MRGDAHDSARRLALAGAVLARIRAMPRACVGDRAFARLAARLASSPITEHRKIAAALGGALTAGDPAAALALPSSAGRRADRRAEKIVSHCYRFLWLCNPRVASRSPIQALMAADPDAELIRGRTLEEIPGLRPALGAYFSFAFVRHPVGRTRSFHADKHGLALLTEGHTGGSSNPGTGCAVACVSMSSVAGWRRPPARTPSPTATGSRSMPGPGPGTAPGAGLRGPLGDARRRLADGCGAYRQAPPGAAQSERPEGSGAGCDVEETPQAAALLRRRCAEEFRLSGYAP